MRKEKEEADARVRQASKNAEKSTGGSGSGSKNWSEDDLQLLIKAVNLFPAGTNSRYLLRENFRALEIIVQSKKQLHQKWVEMHGV